MRIMMIVASGLSYLINEAIATAQYANADKMNFEAPLTVLVWLTSIVSVVHHLHRVVPADPATSATARCGGSCRPSSRCGTLAGAIIPELVKVFTSTNSAHVREVVAASREGGASLNILSGLIAGNFSAYWLGLVIVVADGRSPTSSA